jgi:hypothetical protein
MRMKRLMRKLEAALAAVAFAEEGEVDTARRIAADAAEDEPARAEASVRALAPRARPPRAAKGSRG